jgi:hypothetical protein
MGAWLELSLDVCGAAWMVYRAKEARADIDKGRDAVGMWIVAGVGEWVGMGIGMGRGASCEGRGLYTAVYIHLWS